MSDGDSPPEDFNWHIFSDGTKSRQFAEYAVNNQRKNGDLVFQAVIKAWRISPSSSEGYLNAVIIQAAPPRGHSRSYKTIVWTDLQENPLMLLSFGEYSSNP